MINAWLGRGDLMVRDVKPFVGGFKGLPAYLDGIKIKALMEEKGLTRKQAIAKLKEDKD